MEISAQNEPLSWTRWIPWGISALEFLIILFLIFNSYGKTQTETATSTKPTTNSSSSTNSTKSAQTPLNLNESTKSAEASSNSAEPNRDTRFKIGDKVRAAVNTNIRGTAATTGELLQTVSSDETLEIIEGPVSSEGYWWWKVKITATTPEKTGSLLGLKGYVSEGYWLESAPASSSATASNLAN